MIPSLRNWFNTNFSEATYQALNEESWAAYQYVIPFRQAETPVFLPDEFRDRLIAAGKEIADFTAKPEFIAMSESAIPAGLNVPNDPGFPGMLAIDFAICKDEKGEWLPQLIEMQGFPSLYGYQVFLSDLYQKHYQIPEEFTYLFSNDNIESYKADLKAHILGNHAPENVVLLEIEPYKQKTAIDFYVMEDWTGIKSVCISEIIVEGKKLFYLKDGVKTPIHRIYNRVIFDELLPRTDLQRQFNLTEDVDVEWVCHPNWFFRISKYTLPFIKSQYVPDTRFLNEVTEYPTDLENYVLKPLFSFAGQGVIINVTTKDLDEVTDRENWILQRKVKYEYIFQDPENVGVKAEIRLLYTYDETAKQAKLVANLGRLSKGLMVGVRYNKDFSWVGASSYFFRKK